MLRRASLIVLIACCMGLPAVAQETLNLPDPTITRKPTLSVDKGSFPQYPSAAARAGQSGETMLRTCVDVDGKPHDAEVVKSSGFPVLDEAALAWMKDGARFRPAEASGKPVAVCNYQFTYVWELNATNTLRPSGYVEYNTLKPEERPVFHAPAKAPPYPERTFGARGAGLVTFMLCVAPAGQVVWMEPRKFGAGPDFLEPTIRWIMQGTFTPATVDGKAVGVCGVEAGFEWKAPN